MHNSYCLSTYSFIFKVISVSTFSLAPSGRLVTSYICNTVRFFCYSLHSILESPPPLNYLLKFCIHCLFFVLKSSEDLKKNKILHSTNQPSPLPKLPVSVTFSSQTMYLTSLLLILSPHNNVFTFISSCDSHFNPECPHFSRWLNETQNKWFGQDLTKWWCWHYTCAWQPLVWCSFYYTALCSCFQKGGNGCA